MTLIVVFQARNPALVWAGWSFSAVNPVWFGLTNRAKNRTGGDAFGGLT